MPDICERFPEPVRTALHATLTQAEELARRLRQQLDRQTRTFGELLSQGKGHLLELAAQQPFHLDRHPRQNGPVLEMLRQARRQRQQLHETARRYLPQEAMGEVIDFEQFVTPDLMERLERSKPDEHA